MLIGTGLYGAASLVECRVDPEAAGEAELLVLDLQVSLGQRKPVADIRSVERVAIVFVAWDMAPQVCPLRPDFPQEVPHLNASFPGLPRALCLSEMPPEDAARLATPLTILEGAGKWLRETAHGRLHGDEQPLDPVFPISGYSFILPPTQTPGFGPKALLGFRRTDVAGFPVLLEEVPAVTPASMARDNAMVVLSIATEPVRHARMREIPRDLWALNLAYRELGVDLLRHVKAGLREWLPKGFPRAVMDRRCLLVIRTPIERRPGLLGGISVRAFMAQPSFAELGKWTGAFEVEGNHVGRLLVEPPPDEEKLALAWVDVREVYQGFDRATASSMSGLASDSPLEVTLVGSGAMGSQIALCAARMGVGSWRIVDPDFLLPHNLARHALLRSHVGMTKAEGLAAEIRELLGGGSASSHPSGILEASREPDVLGGADLVLDCSAALPVARWLSAGSHSGRTVSAFLNPTGSDLVLMWEGAERRPRLTCLEMTYYWALTCTAALAGHLRPGTPGVYPAGGCRSPSLRIPQSRLATFSGIAAERLFEEPLPPSGGLEIWARTADGIVPFRIPPLDFEEARAGEWLVSVEAGVLAGIRQARRFAGMLETGGILVGCFDRPRKHAYVVGHYDPPPDSVAGPASFVRGLVGVHRTLKDVETATLGNLTYVGEWHTHPAPASSQPSADDSELFTWIGDVLAFSDLPPVMLIAGEGDIRVMIGDVGIPALFATDRPAFGGAVLTPHRKSSSY